MWTHRERRQSAAERARAPRTMVTKPAELDAAMAVASDIRSGPPSPVENGFAKGPAQKKTPLPVHWKESPDLYLSWALTVAALAEGHVLVDLLPATSQMYHLNRQENQVIGRRFENACKEYLDSSQVLLVQCEPHIAPDDFYMLFASYLQQPSNQAPNSGAEDGESRSIGLKRGTGNQGPAFRKRSERVGGRGHSKQASKSKTRKEASVGFGGSVGSLKVQFPSLKQTSGPVVFILQDIEKLSHETQMALVEILTLKTMPVSFVSNVFGTTGGPESSVLVPGLFEIKTPHVVVALSTALQVPSLPSACLATESNSLDRGIIPDLFQAFLLRVPIKLPQREEILANTFMGDPGEVDLEESHQSRHLRHHHSQSPTHVKQHELQQPTPHSKYIEAQRSVARNESFQENGLEIDSSLLSDPDTEDGMFSPWHSSPNENAIPLPNPGPGGRLLWLGANDKIKVGQHDVGLPPKFYRLNRVDVHLMLERKASVHVSYAMETHLADIITALRMHPSVLSGPSPRCFAMLQNCVKANAAMARKSPFASPADVTDVVVEVLAHQIVLTFPSFPHMDLGHGSSKLSHPRDWHPMTAARYAVAQTAQFFIPTPR